MKKKVLLSVFALFFILTICGSVSAATTDRVSISTNGSASNGYSFEPSISAGGRYVAFTSVEARFMREA